MFDLLITITYLFIYLQYIKVIYIQDKYAKLLRLKKKNINT